MNRSELDVMDKESAIEALNSLTEGNRVLDLYTEDEKEEHESVCAECHHATEQLKTNEDSFTSCTNCQMMEGSTLEVTVVKPLGLGYIWGDNRWIVADESFGQET